MAPLLSTLCFEARRPDDARSPRVPGGATKAAIGATIRLWGELDRLEKENRLDFRMKWRQSYEYDTQRPNHTV